LEPFIAQRVLEALKMTESVGLYMGEMTQNLESNDADERKNRNLAQGLYTSPEVSNKQYVPFIINSLIYLE